MSYMTTEVVEDLLRRVEALEAERARRGPRWTVHVSGYPGRERIQAWREWLAHYGLPAPEAIPATSEIVFDSDTKTLTATRKVKDENGQDIDVGNHQILRETVTVVVDGVLQDFPPGYEVTVA